MTTPRLRRIYVAGPMSGRPEFNYPAFAAAIAAAESAFRALWFGERVEWVSPAHNPDTGDLLEPPATVNEREYAAFIRSGLGLLLTCTHILLLPGWRGSHGACLEHTVATACGITIIDGDPTDEGNLPMTTITPEATK